MNAIEGLNDERITGLAALEFIGEVVARCPRRNGIARRKGAPVVGGFFQGDVFSSFARAPVPRTSGVLHARYAQVGDGVLELGIRQPNIVVGSFDGRDRTELCLLLRGKGVA